MSTDLVPFDNGEFQLDLRSDGDTFKVMTPGLAKALGFREAFDTARTAYTAVRVCGAHAWLGEARRCRARHGGAGPGPARQGIGRTACTQVRALSALARLGSAGQCIAGRGTGSAGRGMAWQGGWATSRPQGASPWRPRTAGHDTAALGPAALGWARHGLEGRLADIEVRVLDARARGLARQDVAMRGAAMRGAAPLGVARKSGWLAGIEIQALDTRDRGCARHRAAARGSAQQGKAVLGTAWTVGRAAHPKVRVLGSHAWRGEVWRGIAWPREAWQGKGAGEWSTSEFESPTPTQGIARRCEARHVRGIAWQGVGLLAGTQVRVLRAHGRSAHYVTRTVGIGLPSAAPVRGKQ